MDYYVLGGVFLSASFISIYCTCKLLAWKDLDEKIKSSDHIKSCPISTERQKEIDLSFALDSNNSD